MQNENLRRGAVWAVAIGLVMAPWMLVLWYVLAFYWTTAGATSVTIGSTICSLLFVGIARYPATVAIAAMAALTAPMAAMGVEPSLLYIIGCLTIGYFAWRKIDWTGDFAVFLIFAEKDTHPQ